MDMLLLIKKFKEFFVGNENAYGYYYKDNQGSIQASTSKKPLTDNLLDQHLKREKTIGSHYAYKIKDDWYCKWIFIKSMVTLLS